MDRKLIAACRKTDKPKMGCFGIPTRLAMLVFGTVWAAAGAPWLYYVLPDYLAGKTRRTPVVLATGLLVGGLAMLKTALTPDRPESPKDEPPDPDPDPLNENWPTTYD